MSEKQDITVYVPSGPLDIKVLTIESSAYLPQIRAKLPNAEIVAIAALADEDSAGAYRRLNVKSVRQDYRSERLDFPLGFFDIIIAAEFLEYAYEPYETALDISRHLKDTGFLVAEFSNIRYHKILRGLKDGRFPSYERRFWTKHEVVEMLNDAVFKEIDFTFGERDDSGGEKSWENFGFDNFSRDLATKTWILKAAKSKASVAALKTLYTKEIRTELARIIHRIEYDVEREKNLAALRELAGREMIFPEYLADFVHEICVHESRVKSLIDAAEQH